MAVIAFLLFLLLMSMRLDGVKHRLASRVPAELHNIVRCANPACITNNEPMETHFYVTDAEKGIIKCRYCEKEIKVSKAKLL